MIRLRPIEPSRDAEALHAVLGNDAACRYLPQPAFATVAETETKLARWAEQAGETDWAILLGDDDTAVGRVTIFHKDDSGVWEAGIIIVPGMQGRGIAGAAMRKAIDHVDRHARPRRIEADIDPENIPSRRLFERLGFVLEGTLRKRWETHIGVRDTVLFALVDTDTRPWRAERPRR